MASGPFPCLGLPPHRLWALRPGVYEDERGRTWVIVVVRLSPSWRAQGRAPRHHAVSCRAWGWGVGGLRMDLSLDAPVTFSDRAPDRGERRLFYLF